MWQKSRKDTIDLPQKLTLASLCSGSGAGELVWDAAINTLSAEFLYPLQCDVAFVCEKEAWKQQYLMNTIVSKDTCVFDDVVTLGAIADRPLPAQPVSVSNPDATDHQKKPRAKAKAEDKLKEPHFCVQHKRCCDPRTTTVWLRLVGDSGVSWCWFSHPTNQFTTLTLIKLQICLKKTMIPIISEDSFWLWNYDSDTSHINAYQWFELIKYWFIHSDSDQQSERWD